jgi:hypothetical protein
MTRAKPSPHAAAALVDMLSEGQEDIDDWVRETDCPEGCYVEPDGVCSHGYESAALTLGAI